ncbi:MAG TPA: monovalent cation:proton antiporter-2 (CPA2) family protein [Burkholderiales bacterium]|jgi:monovalent cation:proton antiporter-2 (CPA2) family protein
MQDGFLHQAFIYLAAGVIVVPIFKRLGLGSVLGYLVAGVAIGPWGLSLVSAPEAILDFAEFGVVLLLFLVGLELNPARVWQLRKPIFGMGATQVAVTVVVVAAAAWALGAPPRVALVVGMGFAMSSTAIGLATLQEKNLLPTPGGQASFSVLLFQDLAVIPLILILGLISSDKSHNSFDWTATAKAVGMIVLLIAVGRFLLRPVLRYVANTRQREIFVGFALLLVIGIAALMELVGLSTALGAFLGGVLLADSEYRHQLELDIEPFKGLLLGLFFIAVGMSVDLGLFSRSPGLIFLIAGGVIALKIAILYPVSKTFGFCGRADATLFALALSQVGEFAFVLFGAAGSILPRATLDLLNAAVAVSMLSTPLLMMLYERVLAPRLLRVEERAADAIDETNPVIIAGFGRFGQVVQRVLAGLKIRATVVDHDPNQIELVRRFGSKAYYGDATRLDLLEAAGARKAKLLVVAVDNPQSALQIVSEARKHFRHLKLVVRARSRTEAFELAEMGVPAVRETFGSALDAAESALQDLGYQPIAARRIVTRFRRHDEQTIVQQAKHRKDTKKLITLAQQGRQDLEQLLATETGGKS